MEDTIEVPGGHSLSLPLAEAAITVQLHAASGACWCRSFPSTPKKNDAKGYVGRSF